MQLRIATRSSPLALWQANDVAARLRQAGFDSELVHVSTIGDRDRAESLVSFGGMGVFTKEVQRVVLDGRADLAVHSLKDLPTEPVPGLTLAAVPPRAGRFDLLVLPLGTVVADAGDAPLAVLPDHALVGTGSPRRRSQLLRWRPDLRVQDIRGNVETRLHKLDEGAYDAIVLAEAGLRRLDLLEGRNTRPLAPPWLFPAVGQGALGIECRSEDAATRGALAALDDPTARAETTAERAALAALRAGCHAPVGALAVVQQSRVTIEVVVLTPDGRDCFTGRGTAPLAAAEQAGEQAAAELIRSGAAGLL